MNYEILTEEVSKALQRKPFNPPLFSASFTEKDFDAEWSGVRKELESYLSQRARPAANTKDWGDFSVSSSRGDSRWIWLTFHSKKHWKKDFCEWVGKFLEKQNQDYCIGCLSEFEGIWNLYLNPCICLFITKDLARGSADVLRLPKFEMVRKDSHLRKVGFPI